MKTALISLLCAFLVTTISNADDAVRGESKILREVKIPTRDGKFLMADIVLPPGDGPFPTIYTHTPYKRQNVADPIPDSPHEKILLDRKNYVYVATDWRGKFGSREAGSWNSNDYLGTDGYDVIEWIAKQPWSNGKVGMWGLSAPGAAQYAIAAQKPPHLVCIVPASASANTTYEQFYYGGVLEELYEQLLPQVGYSLVGIMKRHPTHDRFWERFEHRVNPRDIDLPALMMTGWYDIRPQAKLDTFSDIRTSDKQFYKDMKLLVGPWTHVNFGVRKQGELELPEAEGEYTRETLQFFDYYLRDQKNNGWAQRPPVRYFQMGTNTWHSSNEWPDKTRELSLYLDHDGKLLRESVASKQNTFTFDPENPSPTVGGGLLEIKRLKDSLPAGPLDQKPVESRNDVVMFTTDPLPANLSVLGQPKAELYVSSDREDTDFAVRLTDVYPDGRSILVADGIWRMRYRNSLEEEELMRPGQIYMVTVPLNSTGQTFLKGHRIRLVVSSSNHPRFAVNSNSTARLRIFRRNLVAQNTIYHDTEHPSRLVLSEITR